MPIQTVIHQDPLECKSLESLVDSDRGVLDLDLFFLSYLLEDGDKSYYRLIHQLRLCVSVRKQTSKLILKNE
jgi:hypothetical protein